MPLFRVLLVNSSWFDVIICGMIEAAVVLAVVVVVVVVVVVGVTVGLG